MGGLKEKYQTLMRAVSGTAGGLLAVGILYLAGAFDKQPNYYEQKQLQKSYERIVQENTYLQKKVKENEEQTKALNDLQAAYKKLNADYNATVKEKDSLKSKLERLEQNYKTLEENSKTKIEQLQNQCNALQQEKNSMQSKLEQLVVDCTQLKNEKAELEKKCEELREFNKPSAREIVVYGLVGLLFAGGGAAIGFFGGAGIGAITSYLRRGTPHGSEVYGYGVIGGLIGMVATAALTIATWLTP